MKILHHVDGITLHVRRDEIDDFIHMVQRAVPIDFQRELIDELKKECLI